MLNNSFFHDFLMLGSLSMILVFMLNLAGKLVSPLFSLHKEDKPYFNFFMESLVGFIIITTVYSLLLFGTCTINIISLLFFIFYMLRRIVQKKPMQYCFHGYRLSGLPYLFCVPFLILAVSLALPLGSSVQSDVGFYCKIAESLPLIPKENFFHFFNFHGPEFNGTVPYHYNEMYLGSLMFRLFSWTGYSDLMIFKYVVYNGLRSLVLVGLLAFAEKYKKPAFLEFLWMTLIICIDFVFVTDFDYKAYPLYHGMWMRPNFIIYYLFLVAAFYYLSGREFSRSAVMMLFLIISSLVVAPALFAASGLMLTWALIFRRQERRFAMQLFGLMILLAVFITLFYKFSGVSLETYSLTAKQMISKSLGIWKAIVGYIVTLSARLFVLTVLALLPVLLLGKRAFMDYARAHSVLIVFSVLVPLCGIIIFQALAYLDNMYQFPYVGYVGCYILFIFNFFYAFSIEKTRGRRMLWYGVLGVLVLLGLNAKIADLSQTFSLKESFTRSELRSFGLTASTIDELSTHFNKSSSLKSATLLDARDIKEEYMGFRQNLTAQVGFYLMFLQDNTNIELLADPRDLYPDEDRSAKEYIKATSFNRHTAFYKNYRKDTTYLYNMREYIANNEINCLILSRQFDADRLTDFVRGKRIKDQGTGHQFIILE